MNLELADMFARVSQLERFAGLARSVWLGGGWRAKLLVNDAGDFATKALAGVADGLGVDAVFPC